MKLPPSAPGWSKRRNGKIAMRFTSVWNSSRIISTRSTLSMKSSEELLILTVDDDTVNRKIIERILTVAGYRSVGADSGPAALEILRETTPDLILLDVMMPGMDGYEVCSRLQKSPQTACIPVIFITGLGDRH